MGITTKAKSAPANPENSAGAPAEGLAPTPKGATLAEKGAAIIESYSDEEKALCGAKSETLIHVVQLGLASKKRPRAVTGGNEDSFLPVGVKLTSTIDIPDVPVISATKDFRKESLDPKTELGALSVKAGEEFVVTMLELMYLLARKEYSNTYVDKDGKVITMVPKAGKFLSGEQALPTPAIAYKTGGSPKAHMIAIDFQAGEKEPWQILPEYAEKFGGLLKKKDSTGSRSGGKKSNALPTAYKTAAALRNILGIPD